MSFNPREVQRRADARPATGQRGATDGETAVLVHYLPHVVRSAGLSDWERKFCASLIARSKRGGWTPTAKQVRVLRRLVDNFRTAAFSEPLTEEPDR